MSAPRVTTDRLIEEYKKHKSVYKVANMFGMQHTSVHERLVKAGVVCDGGGKPWTDQDCSFLKERYLVYRDAGKLADLANLMGREKTSVCREARHLGLTDRAHKKIWFATWSKLDEKTARVMLEQFKKSKYGIAAYSKKFSLGPGFQKAMKQFFPDEWDLSVESKAPHQTMYARGRSFEYRTRDWFHDKQFFAMRSPQSRSPLDVIAIKPGVVYFVQCRRAGNLGVSDWNSLYDLAISVGAVPTIASMPVSGGILFEKMLARKDGTKKAQPRVVFEPDKIEAVPKGMRCPCCLKEGKATIMHEGISDGDGHSFIDEWDCPVCGTFVEKHTNIHERLFKDRGVKPE